jgi:hypothetical protein
MLSLKRAHAPYLKVMITLCGGAFKLFETGAPGLVIVFEGLIDDLRMM